MNSIKVEVNRFTFKYLPSKKVTEVQFYANFVKSLYDYTQTIDCSACKFIVNIIALEVQKYLQANKPDKYKSFNYIIGLFGNLLEQNNLNINNFMINRFNIN